MAVAMTKNRTGKSACATQTHTHGGRPILAVFSKGGVLVFVLESLEVIVLSFADGKSQERPAPLQKPQGCGTHF
jgi:hypothetical protein